MWHNRYPEAKKKKKSQTSAEDQQKLNCQKLNVNESLCPKHSILEKCNAWFKRGECIEFYTINCKIKVKIYEDQMKMIGHNIDLIQHFDKATIQVNEEERDSQH